MVKRTFALIGYLLLVSVMFAQSFTEHEEVFALKDAQGREYVLAGTLTVPQASQPKEGFPAVVLVTGSGLENRDEEILGHRPFKVIAEYLSEQGFVVLRCDDRGIGGSTGLFDDVTPHDLAQDVNALVSALRKKPFVDAKKVGIVGHSEGGLLAAMVAAKDPKVGFVVMLAGPGKTMKQTLLEQNYEIFHLQGVPDSLINIRLAFMRDAFTTIDSVAEYRASHPEDSTDRVKQLNKALLPLMKRHNKDLTKEQKQQVGLTTMECYGWALQMSQPYVGVSLNLDPLEYIAKMKCPLMAMNGSLDCQVNAGTHLSAIERVCEQKGINAETVTLMNMNHLFQECKTGAVEEYAELGQSPALKALEILAKWLQKVVAK